MYLVFIGIILPKKGSLKILTSTQFSFKSKLLKNKLYKSQNHTIYSND